MAVGTFSGNGNYKIDVDAQFTGHSGLSSNVYWRIYVIKSNTTGHRAWGNTNSNGRADSNLGGVNDLWYNGNMEYNFQNNSLNGTFLIAEGTFNIGHRSDGNQEYFVTGALNFINLGSASASTGVRSLPRIQTASVPPAPSGKGFGNISQSSIQYLFQNNGDGGAPVREWQARWQNATRNGTLNEYASNGSTDIGGLNPGELYNFWSRGRNDVGWGPWSSVSSARTIAGARVRREGEWRPAVPYVKVNGVWRLAQPYINVDGAWRKTI